MSTTTDSAPPALTRDQLRADKPTWCPGCGDFSVLATYHQVLTSMGWAQEDIATLSGIGCSSRFPYFVNTPSVHFIHGRILPFATGLSLSRPDIHPVVFIGDGDAYSIGGNHFDHAARKNVRLTVVVMDNQVYGLTKKQTSPTSRLGFRSKTDPWGSKVVPVNPTKKLISSGATLVARTISTNPKHMAEMLKIALHHDGFSVVECLSECVMFNEGSFDSAVPRKGGEFRLVPEDHDVTDEEAAYALARHQFPGYFGIYYRVQRPTLNESEAELVPGAPATEPAAARKLLQTTLKKFT